MYLFFLFAFFWGRQKNETKQKQWTHTVSLVGWVETQLSTWRRTLHLFMVGISITLVCVIITYIISKLSMRHSVSACLFNNDVTFQRRTRRKKANKGQTMDSLYSAPLWRASNDPANAPAAQMNDTESASMHPI